MAIYLQLPGIAGGASAVGYQGQIVLTSFSETVEPPAGGPNSFVVGKQVDVATIPLTRALLTGKGFATAVITVTNEATLAVTETIVLSRVGFSSLHSASSAGAPVEELTLDAGSVQTTTSSGTTTGPVADLPESVTAVALPLVGLAAAGAALAYQRRTREDQKP